MKKSFQHQEDLSSLHLKKKKIKNENKIRNKISGRKEKNQKNYENLSRKRKKIM